MQVEKSLNSDGSGPKNPKTNKTEEVAREKPQ